MAVQRVAGISKFVGLSMDDKPTTNVPAGSTFYETDTGNLYIHSGAEWVFKDCSRFALLEGNLTTFTVVEESATDADGTDWVDIIDQSSLEKPVKITGFIGTVGGSWAGDTRVRIVSAAGDKLWPYGDYAVEGVDFDSGVAEVLANPVFVPAATGYKLQFCSSDGGDGEGETFAISLNVIELG